MRDYKFRLSLNAKNYYAAWNACAKLYGHIGFGRLSPDGEEALDPFCAGYKAGLTAGKRQAKKKVKK